MGCHCFLLNNKKLLDYKMGRRPEQILHQRRCADGKHTYEKLNIISVQFSSVAQSCPTPCNPMNHSTPGLPVRHQLPEFTQTHVHLVSDAIQPSHSLSSRLLLPPIPPSIRAFSNESTLHMRWPKYSSFSFSIIPSKEIPGNCKLRQ